MKAKEANILSFKIIVNHSGAILTEMGGLPEDRLHEVFKGDELNHHSACIEDKMDDGGVP